MNRAVCARCVDAEVNLSDEIINGVRVVSLEVKHNKLNHPNGHPLDHLINIFNELFPVNPDVLQREFGHNEDDEDEIDIREIPIINNNYIQIVNIFRGIFIDYLV